MKRYGVALLVVAGLVMESLGVDGITVSCMGKTELPEWGPVEGQLWRHDIKNDAAIRHTRLHDGPVTYPAMSPDGRRVAFVQNSQIVVVSVNGGSESVLTPCSRYSMIDFPHAEWVYFTADNADNGDPQYYVGTTGTMRWTITETVSGESGPISTVSNSCRIRVSAPYESEITEAFSPVFSISATQAAMPARNVHGTLDGISLKVLPSGHIELRYPPQSAGHITLVDTRGRSLPIPQPQTGTTALLLPPMAPGTYLLRISKGQTNSYRLINKY